MAVGRRESAVQHWLMWFVPVETLTEAQNLALRYKEGKAFRIYVRDRLRLVIPVIALMILISVSFAAAFVVVVTGVSGWLALPAIILMPVILLGSLFVQSFVFFAWLENRAVSRTAGQRAKQPQGSFAKWLFKTFGADLGKAPPVPWVLAALFIALPLAIQASFALPIAFAQVVVAVLAPIVFAVFDR